MLEPRTIYLDRYATNADWSLNLSEFMLSEQFRAENPPTSITVTAGNTLNHFIVTDGILRVSAEGAAADLSSGTYNLTVTSTWSNLPAPYSSQSAVLTIRCPTASVYVDPVTGNDNNPGTKASPWAHSPDDINATGNAASFNPSVKTLIVHKDGSFIRSRLVARSNNFINASTVGWGDGTKTTYCGSIGLSAGSNVTQAEVSNNPNYINIRKHTLSSPLGISQLLIDRTNDSLVHWAQWPEVTGDPILESHDPQHHLTGGMFLYHGSNVATDSEGHLLGELTLPPEAVTEFGTSNLTGCILGIWVYASFVNWFIITGHNTSTNVITFTPESNDILQTHSNGNTAIQIIGHPKSIKNSGQFAWSTDRQTVYAWTPSSTSTEIMRYTAGYYVGDNVRDTALYGLKFEGYYGTADGEGSGFQKYSTAGNFTVDILNSEFRWLCNRTGGNGAGCRSIGTGTYYNSLIQGNKFYDCVGAAAFRMSQAGGCDNIKAQSNFISRLNVSGGYLPGARNCVYENNYMELLVGPHANGFTMYKRNDSDFMPDNIIRFNTWHRVCRPITIDRADNLQMYRNLIEIDDIIKDAVRFYGISTTAHVYENIFVQPANVPTTGEDVLAAGVTGAGLWERNAIAGLSGGSGAEGSANWYNNLLTYRPSYSTEIDKPETKPAGNTGEWSGNLYEPHFFTGTIPARWKQVVGPGYLGRNTVIHSIVVVDPFTDLINQEVNTITTSDYKLVTTDTPKTFSIENGEYSIASDSNGTGATAFQSEEGTIQNGQYIALRTTTPSSYTTTKTVSLDFGNGYNFTWNVRTKQAAGWPLIQVDTTDWWQLSSSAGFAGTATKTLTFALYGRFDTTPGNGSVLLGHYAGGTLSRVTIETLANYRLRITGRPAASPEITFRFHTQPLPAAQNFSLILTIDTTKATAEEGVKNYINGADAGPPLFIETWTQDGLIDYPYSTGAFRIGRSFAGILGMMYFDTRLADLTDPDVVDRFNAHRIGLNGENIFGTAPPIFVVGDVSDWTANTGINRGTMPKFLPQSGTAVALDPAGKTAWPSYTFATALTDLTGPDGLIGIENEYSITVNDTLANPITVNLDDGEANGTFTPSTLTIPAGIDAQTTTFKYTPGEVGDITLTASANGLTTASKTISVIPAPATGYTVSASANNVMAGVPVTLTISLNGSNLIGTQIEPSVSGTSGTFSESPIIFDPDIVTKYITFTPTSAGTASLSFTNQSGLSNPENVTITVQVEEVIIEPGTTITLTKAQAATLLYKGSGTFTVRWRRNTENTGALDGVDFDISSEVFDSITVVIGQDSWRSLIDQQLNSIPDGNIVTVTLDDSSLMVAYPPVE